ncbi:MAG: 3-isopropylmalate dehydratase small subunit [Candidatus Latescibacterota bacterium]|nr:3-isopropylmalate dehydratase small subunit [Candidatus Latescibacterota bacterium]
MNNESIRRQIAGRAIPIRGDEIDTDRIIPARYLRTVTFDDLGTHVFEDDRAGGDHPFDDTNYKGASILVANANFGCGSSREHAPQALMRWGIDAFVGESFAEIFFSNCIALGLPCLTAAPGDVAKLQSAVEADPTQDVTCDVAAKEIRFGSTVIAGQIEDGLQQQFVDGSWDALGQLLVDREAIAITADGLPYLKY